MKTYKEFMLECTQLNEGGLARQLSKAKTKTTGHISADRGSSAVSYTHLTLPTIYSV